MSTKMLHSTLVYDADVASEPLSFEKQLVLDRVGYKKSVLEIGSHTGYFSWHLARQACHVTAVELDPRAAVQAKARTERVIAGDIEDRYVAAQIQQTFDVVLFMHVLEHMVDPWRVLRQAHSWLASAGSIIVLLPNIACWRARKEMFFRGAFEYEDTGIMDRTHLRFFNLKTARELLETTGFEIVYWTPTSVCVPLERRMRLLPVIWRMGHSWHNWMSHGFPNLCSEICLFHAVPKANGKEAT